jgi:hypothetical protein
MPFPLPIFSLVRRYRRYTYSAYSVIVRRLRSLHRYTTSAQRRTADSGTVSRVDCPLCMPPLWPLLAPSKASSMHKRAERGHSALTVVVRIEKKHGMRQDSRLVSRTTQRSNDRSDEGRIKHGVTTVCVNQNRPHLRRFTDNVESVMDHTHTRAPRRARARAYDVGAVFEVSTARWGVQVARVGCDGA